MPLAPTNQIMSDYDLYIYKNPRSDCSPADCTATDGSQAADYQSASSSNPEIASISPLADGTQKYTLVAVPFTPTREIINVKIELLPGSGGGGGGPFGGADPTTPGVPRYQTFVAPSGSSAESSQGEFNIGFDPITKRIMVMNIGPIWRLTPGEVQSPAKPECCEALWEDKSASSTNTGLDPILWTDQKTGRTFASNSTAGANAVYAYTDAAAPFNDGDQWVPVGISPPNGGADTRLSVRGRILLSWACLIHSRTQQTRARLFTTARRTSSDPPHVSVVTTSASATARGS